MTLTIQTPTGTAVFYNTHTQKGYKALWQYIKHVQKDKTPFLVLPKGTAATDLHHVTSVDNMQYE